MEASSNNRNGGVAYDDWTCPSCETVNDREQDTCRACSFTTVTEPEPDDRAMRWARAVGLGAVSVVVGLSVLVVGVQQVTTSLVPVPVVAGLAVAAVGMNLAVDSLDW